MPDFKKLLQEYDIFYSDYEYKLIMKRFANKKFKFDYVDFENVTRACVNEHENNAQREKF